MMMKIGLVKTRNKGKKFFYSLNREYFNAIIDVLSKFSSDRGDFCEKNMEKASMFNFNGNRIIGAHKSCSPFWL